MLLQAFQATFNPTGNEVDRCSEHDVVSDIGNQSRGWYGSTFLQFRPKAAVDDRRQRAPQYAVCQAVGPTVASRRDEVKRRPPDKLRRFDDRRNPPRDVTGAK